MASALTTVKTLISARIVGGMSNCLIRASISGMVSAGPATRTVLADVLGVRWNVVEDSRIELPLPLDVDGEELQHGVARRRRACRSRRCRAAEPSRSRAGRGGPRSCHSQLCVDGVLQYLHDLIGQGMLKREHPQLVDRVDFLHVEAGDHACDLRHIAGTGLHDH